MKVTPKLFFTSLATTTTLLLKLLMAVSQLVVLLSRMKRTKKRVCLHFFPWSTNLKSLAKTFINPACQNQFIQENIFNKEPFHRIAIASNTNSAFTESYVENPFRHQQFDVRQIRTFIGCQSIVDVQAGDNCSLQVSTKKPFMKTSQTMFRQFQLINSKTTMYNYLIWHKCRMLLRIANTQN